MERWFESTGTLHYSRLSNGDYRLVLLIDKGIYLFYKSLIPRWFRVFGQRYDPHISVVRKETPTNLTAWGKYEGKRVPFLYSNHIHRGLQYWWLDCHSLELEHIREELGLVNEAKFHKPLDGYSKVFHTTIGNHKEEV